MKVLVTGGAGYVGMNVVEALLERGGSVVLLDAATLPPPAQRALAPHSRLLKIVQADICDAAAMKSLFAQHRFDGVVHCAAVTAGREREARDPAPSIEVNQLGTLNLLTAARE